MSKKGKKEFSKIVSEEIKGLLRKKLRSDKNKQKGIRANIRRRGFYISDFREGGKAFTVDNFKKLIKDNRIKIIK